MCDLASPRRHITKCSPWTSAFIGAYCRSYLLTVTCQLYRCSQNSLPIYNAHNAYCQSFNCLSLRCFPAPGLLQLHVPWSTTRTTSRTRRNMPWLTDRNRTRIQAATLGEASPSIGSTVPPYTTPISRLSFTWTHHRTCGLSKPAMKVLLFDIHPWRCTCHLQISRAMDSILCSKLYNRENY